MTAWMRAAVLLVALLLLWALLQTIRCAPLPVAPGSVPRAGASAAAGLLFGARLDLNSASARDLEALPGIGPGRAAKIVVTRAALGGRFARVADLLAVPGLGAATLARLHPYVTVTPDKQPAKEPVTPSR